MEKQSERKNNRSKAVIIVIAMLLMVALVVGMGAMTYSKYITSGTTGDQTATAAKWGFVVTVNATDLFGTDYTKGESDEHAKVVTTSGSTGVAVDAESKAVAPGTTGFMTISVSGTAEVKAKLTIAFTGDTKEIHYGEDYYPVKWTLNDGSSNNLVTDGKLADVKDALENNSTINAGYKLTEKTYTLTWKWAFDGDNTKDTAIGKKANDLSYTESGVEIEPTMSFNITISVEQIQ